MAKRKAAGKKASNRGGNRGSQRRASSGRSGSSRSASSRSSGRGSAASRGGSSTSRTSSRSGSRRRGSSARASSGTDALSLLRQDHQEVRELFEQFEEAEEGTKSDIAERICLMLSVHAQIEEEILYPAAREALDEDDSDLVDEAAVEHTTAKDLVSQIEAGSEGEELYDAKVKVLGEYVTHHVKEEEGELFPKLREAELDLEGLGQRLAARKAELMGGEGGASAREMSTGEESEEMDVGSQGAQRGSRSGGRAGARARSR